MVKASKLTIKRGAILLLMSIFTCSIQTQAYVKIVIDPYCTGQVVKNMGLMEATEQMHNEELEKVAKEQEKIAGYTTTMAAIKEAYKETMQNVKGFGTESKYYVEIGATAVEIVTRVPKLCKTISKAKLPGQAASIIEVTNLYARTQQLVGDFVNIVNNAKVANPLKGGTAKKKNDGYNFLSRYDRLNVANKILTDLHEINYKLELMEYIAQYTTWRELAYKIDPVGFCNILGGKIIAENIISDWKRL